MPSGPGCLAAFLSLDGSCRTAAKGWVLALQRAVVLVSSLLRLQLELILDCAGSVALNQFQLSFLAYPTATSFLFSIQRADLITSLRQRGHLTPPILMHMETSHRTKIRLRHEDLSFAGKIAQERGLLLSLLLTC